MSYEWDPKKAKSNFKKHRVKFADAVGVFEDEHEREDRFITIGMNFLSRILVIVYTFRDIVIRIISARKATTYERKMYEQQDEERI